MIKIEKLNPFGRMCISLGMLPSSYKESLTYEEQLLWFFKYLDETVIPTVNNNAEAVEELQALYIQIKTYVDEYFENLDVQEEINNKLDDMAESGQLTDIIAQYLGLAGVLSFNTVADLKEATNLVNGSTAKTLGFHSLNDGGEGLYKIRTITNEDVVDEITILSLNDETLIAELIYFNELNVKRCGAYGDNTHDDTSIIQACANICNNKGINMIIDKGTYLVSSVIEMPVNVDIISKNATINASQTTGEVISCNRSGYTTGSQPKYTMKGNLRIDNTNVSNTVVGLHIGASKKSLFRDITITNCLSAGILIKSTYSGDVDNFNLNMCHCYNTGGLIIESGENNITGGSITDGSVRNCIIDSPLQKSAITINKVGTKSIFGIKFDRNFLNASNYPVLTINNSSDLSGVSNHIYYLEFIENSVEIRNSVNNPLYATITGVSNSVFDLQGQLINTSGYDINSCKNCTFKRIEYSGYLGLNDKIIDIDSNSYNITFEKLIIPFADFWFNSAKSWVGAMKCKWNDLIVDNGMNNKIVDSLPFNNVITSINDFDNILSLADTPATGYSLRLSSATSSDGQLTVTFEKNQNSPRIEMPIFSCKNSFVGVHIRFKLNNNFEPTGTAKLQLIPFNNFDIRLDTETNKWYDVCIIVPYSSNKTYFGINGYLDDDLSVTIDKFEIIDGFELPYFYNYNLISGKQ